MVSRNRSRITCVISLDGVHRLEDEIPSQRTAERRRTIFAVIALILLAVGTGFAIF